MPEYTISSKDLSDAESFLVEFQTEQVPEANLEVGGAVRDILIKGFAAMYAFLRGEIDRVEARQSLLRIQDELTDEDDISQAVDELLSNWFVTRKDGLSAQMTARMHFTEKRAQSIPLSSRFWRTNTTVFTLDSEVDPYVIAEEQLFPTFDSSGALLDYVVDVPMVALRAGTGYNIEPGNFVRVQVPGGLPYFSYAENTEESDGGKNIESSDEMIDRAGTAISVRNLINNRSCDATLQELFPSISETLTIGMGETEQVRDRRTEIARHIRLHIGGHYDTYLTLPLTTIEENMTVGGYFVRPDNIANVFRDPELTYDQGRTFTSIGVQPGHILYIRDGLVGAPRGFVITSVSEHSIEVSVNTPFTEASDELDTNAVQYSIGWTSPGFEEVELTTGVHLRTAIPSVLPASESVPYGTSRRVQEPGKVVLSGKPVQDILWVEITDPPSSLSDLIDPSTDTLIFFNRVNMTPAIPVEPAYTQFQMEVSNWEKSQSMDAVNKINLGGITTPPNSIFDGYNLRVVYQSLSGFAAVDTHVTNRNYRVAAANQLVRARHPIWIEVNVPYKLKPTATEVLDEKAAAIALAAHINNFDPNDDLDVSDLSSFIRNTYDVVGAVSPLEVYYHIDSPDGQQAYFSSTGIISIYITSTNGVAIENAADITPPQDLINRGIEPSLAATINTVTGATMTAEGNMLDWFTYVGISDRTVHYRTVADMISFEVRS